MPYSPELFTTSATLDFSGGTLTLKGIPAPKLQQWFDAGIWKSDPRIEAERCDAIHYEAILREFQRRKVVLTDNVPLWREVPFPEVSLHSLRPDQKQAVDAWKQHRRGVIVMPTGTGKTEVGLTIISEARTSTLVVSPVRDLMYQWHRRILKGLHYDAGIIGDSVFRVSPVSVTTYDSACIHMERLGNQFGLIVFDECHHLPGLARRDAARMCAAPFRLGLTATLERSDGRHSEITDLIGPTLFDLPLSQASGSTLADYEVVRIPVHLSDEEQGLYDRLSLEIQQYVAERRKDEPDFNWLMLCEECGTTPEARRAMNAFRAKQAIEDRATEKLRVLEDLFRLHIGERCIVFAGSNAMARDVSRRFLIPCLLNHCGKRERLDILQGLEAGDYPAIVANQVLDEGVDIPAAKVAIVIGGHASSRQARQRLGRVLRKSGNAKAVLYEVVCAGTGDEQRSRKRRGHEAFEKTRTRRRS